VQPPQETDGNRLSTFGKIMIALAVPFLLVLGWSVYSFIELRHVMVTRATLDQIRTASVAFQKMLGRWPVALPELINNTNGHVFFMTAAGGFVDGWKRPLVYVPPAGTNTGMIMSFGRDGMPGGTGRDADITVPVP
jgi:hypothetical protein